MSNEIRSAMSSIPEDKWERAFGKKEEKTETYEEKDLRLKNLIWYGVNNKESDAENS